MAIEIKCPYNDDIVLQSLAQYDSTFNIITPFSFEKIEDHSYGINEKMIPVDEIKAVKVYDDNGNYIYTDYPVDNNGNKIKTGRKILSAVSYEYRFPYKQKHKEVDGTQDNLIYAEQNNSMGWFNSWDVAQGSINYSLGNNWTFDVIESAHIQSNQNDWATRHVSGRMGLNEETELAIIRSETQGTEKPYYDLVIRNNNAVFDYFLQGPNYQYLKFSKMLEAKDPTDTTNDKDEAYWFKVASVTPDYSVIRQLYRDIESQKGAIAKEYGIEEYPLISPNNDVYFTPSQLEAKFGIDMNNARTMFDVYGSPKYEWRIYGAYWYNGKRKLMECNSQLQASFNAMMLSQQLKANYSSFRLLITYVTQLASDIIYDNIEYAHIVLVQLKDGMEIGPDYRWAIGDTIKISLEDGQYCMPDSLTSGDRVTISTPNAISKPEYLINDTFLVDFPCYKIFGDTMKNIYQTNFSYNKDKNTTEFDIVVKGLAADDLDISNSDEGWRLLHKRTSYILPPLFDRKSGISQNNPDDYIIDVTNSAKEGYPISMNIPDGAPTGLYLSPDAKYADNTFGNYNNKLTLGSRYPMTSNAAVRFAANTIFHVEVDGDYVGMNFTISSPSMSQSQDVFVRYNGLVAKTSIEKIDNTITRDMNGVELQPYMYDATKIKVDYKLTGGMEIEINNDEVYLTISDNTGAGKSVANIQLSKLVKREYNDLIYTTGLAKNEVEGYYEIIIFMAAKCDNSPFIGFGFNDSTVLVRFNINERYKQLYNLSDADYNVVYITTLPPYLIQGTPYTEHPEQEKVLNSEIAPENTTARVDYNYRSYADNVYGYTSDSFFSNGAPIYKCEASAFIPTNFNGTISGVYCGMLDSWTGGRWPVAWTSADKGDKEYAVLTSGNSVGYDSTNVTQTAKANVKLWTFTQVLDIPSIKEAQGIVSNKLEISAHLDYTTIDEDLAKQNNMVTIRATT